MRKIKVLIACEESQTELKAFLAKGADAYSCDIQPCSGGIPERHYQMDCRKVFKKKKWDLIICHPPCTYLSRAAAAYLYRGHKLNQERFEKGLQARSFFYECLNAPAKFVCVENPTPFKIFDLPKPNFVVNPSDFGSPWLKRTLYWTKNLPPLIPTCHYVNPKSFIYSTKGGKKRSKSFPEIAEQMAAQWLPFIIDAGETITSHCEKRDRAESHKVRA